MKKLFLLLSLTAFSGVCIAEKHTVTVSNNAFTPQNLTISVGDSVEWVVSEGEHTTTSGSECNANGFWSSSTLVEGMKYAHGFPAAGTFHYFCIMHCSEGMTGTITVSESSTGINSANKPQNNIILRNYPNPFNNITTFNFNATKSGKAEIQILSLEGKTINTQIVNVKAGENSFPVALDLPSGMYLVKLEMNGIITKSRIMARKE